MELRRVRKEELGDQQHWDLYAVAEQERGRIVEWLKEQARDNLRKPKPTKDTLLAAAPVLEGELKGFFAILDDITDPDLIERAATGALAREAPSLAWIRFTNFMRWLLVVTELGVFGGLWLFGGAHPAVIIPGVLLAVGGLLLGMGTGREFGVVGTTTRIQERGPRILNWLAILFGVSAIAGVTYIRVRLGEEEGLAVGVITLVLAVMISFFEAAYEYGKEKYERLRDKMYLAQLWTATKRHIRDVEEGFWRTKYSDEVLRILGAVDEAHAPIYREEA